MKQSRLEAQRSFVEMHGWANADLFPLDADASNRSYIRLIKDNKRCLLMDAPPATEKLPEYIRISNHLKQLGLRVPKVFASDTKSGLALIEDFGEDTFTRLLGKGEDETALYLRAGDVLAHLHHAGAKATYVNAPPYDIGLMLEEVGRFLLWFVPAVRGTDATASETKAFSQAWSKALDKVAKDRTAFVFRDFHVDNLMVVPGADAIEACGLLDFQDGLIGPAAYDMVSLLEDARRDVALKTRTAVLESYFKSCPDIDEVSFTRDMDVLGAQRHTKIAGLFVRLSVQDAKHGYLQYLERVLALLGKSLAKPGLEDVQSVMEGIVPGVTSPDFRTRCLQMLGQPN